jgi:hypothetical protein
MKTTAEREINTRSKSSQAGQEDEDNGRQRNQDEKRMERREEST